jgi:hypothetical protein
MNLPPRALQALVDLKQELLSKSEVTEPQDSKDISPDHTAPLREDPERRTPERTMRHARLRAVKFQRICQNRQRF